MSALGSGVVGNKFPATPVYVDVRETWASTWETVPRLFPREWAEFAGPNMSYARLSYHFGGLKPEWSEQTFTFPLLSLRDYYCRISIQVAGQGPVPIWWGVITDEQADLDRPTESGEQIATAFGLGHLLDARPLSRSKVKEANDNDDFIEDAVPFNARTRFGFAIDGNRSTEVNADGVYIFSIRDGEQWTNKDILEYLLEYKSELLGVSDNFTVELAGQAAVLDDIVEVHDLNGLTFWGILNRLIDRRRGLGFTVRVSPDDAILIHVFTVVDVDVAYGSKTLPANPDQTAFTIPSQFPYKHLLGNNLPWRSTSLNRWSKLVVQSEPVLHVANFSIADGSFVKNWSSSVETDFVSGLGSDANENDLYRSRERFEGVFGRFKIPDDWDFRCGDGEGNEVLNVALTANADGTFDDETQGPFWRSGWRFERNTPFQFGKDYTASPIDDADAPTNTEPEFVPLFGLIKYQGTNNEDDAWYYLERMTVNDELETNASVRPLDNEPGVEISVNPRQFFAKNHWAGAGESNESDPIVDYEDMIFVCAWRGHVRQKIEIDLDPDAPDDAARVKVIEVPGAEYWRAAKGTIVGTDDQLGLQRINEEEVVLRDDKAKLEATAAFAKHWFGERRQAISIPLNEIGKFVEVGAMLTEINGVWGREPVRSPVTGRRCIYAANSVSTTIETGWGNLDFDVAPAT